MLAIVISLLHGLNNYAPAIQAIAVVVGVIYGGIQIREVARQTRLSRIVATSLHLKDVNALMARDQDIADTIGESRAQAFLDILLGTFAAWYLLRAERLISEREWRGDLTNIKEVMTKPQVKEHWLTTSARKTYHPDFVNFVDAMLGIEQKRERRLFSRRTANT